MLFRVEVEMLSVAKLKLGVSAVWRADAYQPSSHIARLIAPRSW